jgi:hypothetical protein
MLLISAFAINNPLTYYVSTSRRNLGRGKIRLKYALWRGKKDVENELGKYRTYHQRCRRQHCKRSAVERVPQGNGGGVEEAGIDEFLNALNSTDVEGGTEYYGY